MARTAKAVIKESAEATIEKTETPVVKDSFTTGKTKIRMIKTYMGPFGTFYAGGVYELEGKILSDLLKNGDAKKC